VTDTKQRANMKDSLQQNRRKINLQTSAHVPVSSSVHQLCYSRLCRQSWNTNLQH